MGTIMRVHSDPAGKRQPWVIGGQPNTEKVFRQFVLLRYSLLPQLIEAGEQATRTGFPIVRALELYYPELEDATRRDQYFFTSEDLLVAPIDPFANGGKNHSWNSDRTVFLPPGNWIDAFDS